MSDDPRTWVTTTHAWGSPVDLDHLRDVRERSDELTGGGLRHLVLEVLAYAAEEAEALGRTGTCTVTFRADGWVMVSDDGRGTEARRDTEGEVVLKPVMATKDVRFYDVDGAPLLTDGRPRRGISVVSALSRRLVHTSHRAEGAWTQRYEYGVPSTGVEPIEPTGRTGTTVAFQPDTSLVDDLAVARADVAGLDWLDLTVVR